ncbi:uroporphyrinogen-III C-methyltransferase [Cellulomonas endometrii]|uniref:uroporphyrinogen-III C-methyltransferase n=1 Tax=Cellulomonas endometrii TaxID=3036301 RepID=UPI0024ACD00B|nr:uroporphyrinogen-III C-methyltransferase [Cellulomonas endometrii]
MTLLAGLDVAGRPVLVVGGGPVAARRARTAVDAGADVLVVAPEVVDDLLELEASGVVRLRRRPVREADVADVWFVWTCTGLAAVDDAVVGWASARRVFCVAAADARTGTARTPAAARIGGLLVGVLSEGVPDPRRAAAVRDRIVLALLDPATDTRAGRPESTGPDVLQPGEVALVGGGTGDPALMTVRARTLLAQADVVVTDRLGPTSVLAELREDVRVISVGKAPGVHTLPQAGINAVLVEQALAGRRVVRLKGGDPFLFGRGGEEVLACRAAGVPVRVVPGVTSAVAAAEAAGIPVTHRGTSARLHVVNGHGSLTELDLAALRTPDVTVVVLMGLSWLDRLTAEALAAGVDPATPAAVVSRATLPDQRVVRAPLSGLAARCAAEGLPSPAVVVVGEVARPGLLDPLLVAGAGLQDAGAGVALAGAGR